MEKMSTIAVMAVLIFAAIGIASAIIYLFGKSDKRKEVEKGNVIVRSDSYRLESNPCTPYENLWRKTEYPMRDQSYLRLITMDLETIAGREDHAQREEIYKDEILHLMNKSALCDKGEADSSVRKFCIEQTMPHDDPKNRIDEAEIIYRYITTGKIPNKEE